MKYLDNAFRFLFYIGSSIVILLSLGIVSCSDSDVNPEPEPQNEFLLDADLVYTATAQQVKLLAQFSGLGLDVNEFKYDIEIFNITYRTIHNGSDVTASGLIVLPKTTEDVAMISFQHGTITRQDDAPSNFSPTNADALIYGALSSSGFITVIPDYLGFGTSSSIFHPYYVEELTASAVMDMLKAAEELARDKEIEFNTRLFLAGYSEGGYATMATHKALEENSVDGFELIASFPGAGAYDIKGMQQYLFGLETYDDPYYLAYLARAYQSTYHYPAILTDFFNEPYASRIPSLFDGQHQAEEIDAQLSNTLGDLIQENLLNNLDTDPLYGYLVDAFNDNSLTDWAPEIKMYMYHGESDTTVPYQNSLDTYNALLSNGASTGVLTLLPLDGDHSSAITPYISDFVPKLWELR